MWKNSYDEHEVSGETYNEGIVYLILFNVDVNDMLFNNNKRLEKGNYN